ncbi:MAG: hypothetical protein P4L93_09545 [Coriobacteriia bacterium]|nr:hypothetical protein [Coriobacteriia bacterium]
MGQGVTRALDLARHAALVAILAAGIALTIGVGGPWGWVLAIVAGGALTAAVCRNLLSAGVVGAVVGGFGGGLAVLGFRAPRAVNALSSWHVGYPQSEVHGEFLGPLIRSSAVNGHWGRADFALVLTVMLGVSVLAMGARWLASRTAPDRAEVARAVLGGVAVTAIAVALILAAYSSPFRLRSTHPLAAGTYRYDAAIYMNAYFNLLKGMPYYPGFVKAASGDTRLIAEKDVRNGKFYGWAYSASFIRMPWTFYIWRVLAPGGGLFYWSLLLCVVALFAVWWGLYPSLTARAALVPPVLFPLLLMCTSWMNLFFPDWWAGLAILFSIMLQIRKRYVWAGVFALLAGIFRDVALIWLAILLLWAIYRGWREGAKWWRFAGLYAAFMLGFFVLYFVHLRAGAPFVAPQPGAPDIKGRLAASAADTFGTRFIAPAAYMMVPYGTFIGKRALPLFAQLPGWWLVLRRNKGALVPVLAFATFWVLFTATIGATSSYWGQMYTPIALVGSAALFAWAAPAPETV